MSKVRLSRNFNNGGLTGHMMDAFVGNKTTMLNTAPAIKTAAPVSKKETAGPKQQGWKPTQKLNNAQVAKGPQENNKEGRAKIADAKTQMNKLQAQGPQEGSSAAKGPADGQRGAVGVMAGNAAVDTAVTAGLSTVSPEAAAAYAVVAIAQDLTQVAKVMGQGSQVTHNQASSEFNSYQKNAKGEQVQAKTEGYGVSANAPSQMQTELNKMSQGPGFGKTPVDEAPLDANAADYASNTLPYISGIKVKSPEMNDAVSQLNDGRTAIAMNMKRVDDGVNTSVTEAMNLRDINEGQVNSIQNFNNANLSGMAV